MRAELRFRFPESRQPRLLQILELAKAGQCTERTLTRGKLSLTVFQTLFDLLRPDLLAPALSLAQALREYRGAEVWGNDQPLRFRQVIDVLLCYQQSFGTSDPTAHCWIPVGLHRSVQSVGQQWANGVITWEPPPANWNWPCRFAQTWAWQIRPEHPASIRAQVETGLTQKGCGWCPRLQDLSGWEARQWEIRPSDLREQEGSG